MTEALPLRVRLFPDDADSVAPETIPAVTEPAGAASVTSCATTLPRVIAPPVDEVLRSPASPLPAPLVVMVPVAMLPAAVSVTDPPVPTLFAVVVILPVVMVVPALSLTYPAEPVTLGVVLIGPVKRIEPATPSLEVLISTNPPIDTNPALMNGPEPE